MAYYRVFINPEMYEEYRRIWDEPATPINEWSTDVLADDPGQARMMGVVEFGVPIQESSAPKVNFGTKFFDCEKLGEPPNPEEIQVPE